MPAPFRPTGQQTYRINVPRRDGPAVARGTGTSDPRIARQLGRLVDDLADARRWDLLERVTASPPLASLAELWDHRHDLDGWLHAALHPPPPTLREILPQYTAWLASRGLSKDRQARNPKIVASVGLDTRPAEWTAPLLSGWLAGVRGGSGTLRSRIAVLSMFWKWARSHGYVTGDPIGGVWRPPAPQADLRYHDWTVAARILAAAPAADAAGLALAYGAAADASSIGQVRARDVDVATKTVRVRGEKTAWRDRIVRVADYAWPFIARAVAGADPMERIAPGDRWRWAKRHAAAEAAAGVAHLPLRASRHTFAVRLARAGAPPALIGQQLGHKDGHLVLRVYGRYIPRVDELERWEQAAQQAGQSAGQYAGTTPAS